MGLGLVIGSGVLHQSHHDDSSHQVGEGVFDEDDGTADFLLNPDVEEDDGDAVGNSDRVRPQFPPTVPLKPNPKDVAKERNHKAGLERGDKQVESERRQKLGVWNTNHYSSRFSGDGAAAFGESVAGVGGDGDGAGVVVGGDGEGANGAAGDGGTNGSSARAASELSSSAGEGGAGEGGSGEGGASASSSRSSPIDLRSAPTNATSAAELFQEEPERRGAPPAESSLGRESVESTDSRPGDDSSLFSWVLDATASFLQTSSASSASPSTPLQTTFAPNVTRLPLPDDRLVDEFIFSEDPTTCSFT